MMILGLSLITNTPARITSLAEKLKAPLEAPIDVGYLEISPLLIGDIPWGIRLGLIWDNWDLPAPSRT